MEKTLRNIAGNIKMRPLQKCGHRSKKNNNIIGIFLIKNANVLTDSRRNVILLTWIQIFEFHTVRRLVASRAAISFSRWAVLPRAKTKCGLVSFSSIILLRTLKNGTKLSVRQLPNVTEEDQEERQCHNFVSQVETHSSQI